LGDYSLGVASGRLLPFAIGSVRPLPVIDHVRLVARKPAFEENVVNARAPINPRLW
jgi:hypothetical protein